MTEYVFIDEAGKQEIFATYTKGGKLKKVYAKKGALDLGGLDFFIPSNEINIDWQYLNKIEPESTDFFTKAQKAWLDFYETEYGLPYRFTVIDGQAIKSIGKHLTKISGGTMEALESWRFILANWRKLDAFYRQNADLKFVNSQLNKILNVLKNGKPSGPTAKGNNADGLRGRFTS